MMILKHSFLNPEKNLVKTLYGGRYGMYDLNENREITEPRFECLQYHELDKLIWARLEGFYFIISNAGEWVGSEKVAELDWEYIDKNDRCPNCNGCGCEKCFKGSIPIGGDFSFYHDFDF